MSLRKYLQLLVAFLPFGKQIVYRTFFGAKIADRVRIGFGAILFFDEMDLCSGVRIAPFTYLNIRKIFLGVRSTVGRFSQISVRSLELGPSCTIAHQVSIKGDPANPQSVFTAGAGCWVFQYCYIDVARPVSLGRNVGVGGGTYIFSHGFWLSPLHGYPVSFGDVKIGNDVWLPWGCFILPGVEIGNGVVIGARSVVNKNVPSFALAAGVPAKVIRDKVNAEVTVEQRIDLLLQATAEFCSRKRSKLEVERTADWVVLSIGGVRQVAIARSIGADLSVAGFGDLLQVVHEPLKTLISPGGALYSTESFQCTPRHSFNEVQSAWLDHLGATGTRHYPIDEVSVE